MYLSMAAIVLPYRNFTTEEKYDDAKEISRHVRSDPEMGLCASGGKESKCDYSNDSFYEKSPLKECDVFICLENGKLYVPARNELLNTRKIYPATNRSSGCIRRSII